MKYLLDVNALVAWGWADHADHERAALWIASTLASGKHTLLTSAIPQLGFVRVSVQRSQGKITPQDAGKVLEEMLDALGKAHQFLADDQNALKWPAWCQGHPRTTDAHLLALAEKHGARLVTLDQGIPGAVMI